MFPDNHTLHGEVSDARRAFLMGNALVCGVIQKIGQSLYRFIYGSAPVSTRPIEMKRNHIPTLDLNLFIEGKGSIIIRPRKKNLPWDLSKNLLIGFVKPDTEDYFLNGGTTKLYYTGKTKSFPSTVALNKLHYFMPYIKGRGVRDIYYIRVARIGNKGEIHKESKDSDPRLVFELEYVKSLPDYLPVRLDIFQTYKDTTLRAILDAAGIDELKSAVVYEEDI